MKLKKKMSPFTRNLSMLVAVGTLLFVSGISASAIVRYKPDGVPDNRRAEYEQKIAEIKLKNELLEASTTTSSPSVSIAETSFDFGLLEPHTTASHSFQISNQGQDPLALEVLSTSCKCTTGILVNGLLRTGESTSVNLTWNTGREADHYEQTAVLKTNDPQRPSIELLVKGTVRAEFVAPHEIGFSASDPGSAAKSSFIVYSQLWNRMTVESVTSDLGLFEWNAEPIDVDSPEVKDKNSRSAWRVTVFTTALEYGKYSGTIEITASPGDGNDQVTRSVACSGKVRAPIGFYSPDIHSREGLDLGTMKSGELHQFQVVARVRGDVDRKIEVLDIKPDVLSASLEPMSQKGSYRLTITVPKDCPMVLFNSNHKHGYIQVGDPMDSKFANWFPIMGAVVEIE